MSLSQLAKNLQPSATLAVTARAKEMKRAGKPVISFSVGEPDFVSPPAVLQAGREAIDKGYTHYTANPGIPELREAVCAYYKRRFGLDYKPEQTLIASGAKPLIYFALAAAVNPGDEVIVITPAWVSYVEQVKLVGGVPVIVDASDTENVPSIERLEKAITPRTRAIILNSPNNPTGAVYSAKVLHGIADLAVKHDFVIINDEIYERLVYGNTKFVEIVAECPEVMDRTIQINGASKALAMTGWRIGWGLGPLPYIKAMSGIQGHVTSNACSIAQYAALGGLNGSEADVEKMRKAFGSRRNLTLKLLDDIPGLSYVTPHGAFYVLVNLKNLIGKSHNGTVLTDDAVICADLLESKYVAVTPGSAFFANGTMRVSYASSEKDITEGMKRINEYVSEVK